MVAFVRRHHAAIVALVLAANLLWSAIAFRGIAVGWDESVYVGMGRYLFTGGKEGLFEPIRPPGWPVLLGMLDWAHVDAAVAGRFLMAALLFGSLLAMRDILRPAVDEALVTVFCAAVFLAPQLVGCRVALLTHVPAAFFSLIALTQYRRDRYFLAGLCFGAAFAVRFTFLIVAAAAAVVTLAEAVRARRARALLALSAGVAVPMGLVLAFSVLTNIDEVGFWAATVRPLVLGSSEQSNATWAKDGLVGNLSFYAVALGRRTLVLLLAVVALAPAFFGRLPPALRVAAVSLAALFAYYTWAQNKQERFALDFVFFAGLCGAWVATELLHRARASARLRDGLLVASVVAFSSVHLGTLVTLQVPPPPTSEAYFAQEHGKKILTVAPTFAPYAEQNLFIPLYMRHEPPLIAFHRAAGDADYVVYEPSFFFCGDEPCRDQVRSMEAELARGALVATLPLRDKTAKVYRLR